MAVGWRHTYSRQLDERPDVRPTVVFAAPANQSSFYYTAAEACTSGWNEIKNTVWSGDLKTATSSFVGGNSCRIEQAGKVVAYFRVRSPVGIRNFSPPSNIKTISRPDGSVLTFELESGAWVNRLDPNVTLEQQGTGWVFTDANQTRETFDASGKLTSIESRQGLVTTIEYGASGAEKGKLVRVVGPFGHSIRLSYSNSNGLVSSQERSGDRVKYFSYDGRNRLVKTRQSITNNERSYHYEISNLPDHLTGITDGNGDRYATWSYDTFGRAILSEYAGGKRRVQFAYNADDTTTLTLGNGASRTYHYTTVRGERRLSALTGDVCGSCSSGDTASRIYDSNGFLSEVRDWNGNVTETIRNSRGLTEILVEGKGSPAERTTTTTWHPLFRLPTRIVSPKNTTDFSYDANGNLETLTKTAGSDTRTWTFTNNMSGQVLTIDGPRTDVADVTTITYYDCASSGACGRVASITNALGHVTTYDSYRSNGRPVQITDPNGLKTVFHYNHQRLLSKIELDPTTGQDRNTEFTYDAAQQLQTVATPDDMVLTYAYDAAHYLTSVTDNLGNRIEYDYDVMGNPMGIDTYDSVNALKRQVDYVYDLNSRLDSVSSGGFITDVVHDLVGNLTSVTDPALASTQYVYDALNRLDQTIDAMTGLVDYEYDAHDNLTSVSAANGAVTTFVYDGLDNLTQETSPDRGTITYTYDDAGNRVTKLDARGRLTTYTYDALNRLVLETFDGGTTVAYEYDVGVNAIGRLNKMTDASGSTTWTYNNFGETISKTQTIGTVALTARYGYNSRGKLTSMKLPSGRSVTYGYNAHLPNSVSVDGQSVLSGTVYEPFGPVSGWIWGNGSASSREFDLRGLVTNQTLAGVNQNLRHDPAGRIIAATGESYDLGFGYDPLGRLTTFEAAENSSPHWLALAEMDAPDNEYLQSVTVVPGEFSWTPTMPTTPGVYEFRLFRTGGYERIATSDAVTVFAPGTPPAGPSIDISAALAEPGASITATMTAGPGNARDWLALAHRGDCDADYVQWIYVPSGSTTATWQVTMPTELGDYEFRLFRDNGFDRLATSPTVTVSSTNPPPPDPSLEVSATSANPGVPVTATMTDGPGNAQDWLALVQAGACRNEFLEWVYVGAGATSATWTIDMPATEGDYEFRLFKDNGYTLLAESEPVTVYSATAAIAVSNDEALPGETLTVTVPATLGIPSGVLPAAQAMSYDANGNRSSFTENGTSYSYSNQASSNRLLSMAGPVQKTYTYDAAGNVISDGIHSYGYDDRGRLVDVDSGSAFYQYNGQGQRVKKDNGTATLFVYDEAGRLLGEYDASGMPIQEHVWFDDAPVAVVDGTTVHYVQTDHLGTPRIVIDGQTVIWRWESDPFGSTAAQEDPDGDMTAFTYNLRFPGQYYDQETGLHYNYFRTYDPTTGRYLESDPIGLDGGLNTYGYALQNPLLYTDPTGEGPVAGTACMAIDLMIAINTLDQIGDYADRIKQLEKDMEESLACMPDETESDIAARNNMILHYHDQAKEVGAEFLRSQRWGWAWTAAIGAACIIAWMSPLP